LFILDINELIKLSTNLSKEISTNYAFYRYYYIIAKVRLTLNNLNKDYYLNLGYNIVIAWTRGSCTTLGRSTSRHDQWYQHWSNWSRQVSGISTDPADPDKSVVSALIQLIQHFLCLYKWRCFPVDRSFVLNSCY